TGPEVRSGSAGADQVTVKQPAQLPTPLSGFVTRTVRAPVAAPLAMLTFALRSPALTNVTVLTVIPAPNDTVAPETNLDPSTSTSRVVPCVPWFGLVEVGLGLRSIVRHDVQVPDSPPGLVIVTFLAPAAAEAPTLSFSW